MDILEPPNVITAISDPEFEGLVSSALFSQGWSVVSRALDFSELQMALKNQQNQKILVIFSTDLPGANKSDLAEIAKEDVLVFGFTDEAKSDRGFANIFPRPKSPEELLSVILENIRAASGRAPLIHAPLVLRARVIAVGGVRHSTGNTTFAINLSQEFALMGFKTLLIDANFPAPAIATLLDIRHLAREATWIEIAPNLSALELTQEKMKTFDQLVNEAGDYFDQIIIDLGSVTYLARDLSDRRWSSVMKIWASRNAADFCVISNSELLTQKCSDDFIQSASNLSPRTKIHHIKTLSPIKESKKLEILEKSFADSGSNWSLPWDQRACQAAIAERSTLVQVSERGALRREILTIAQALGGKSRK